MPSSLSPLWRARLDREQARDARLAEIRDRHARRRPAAPFVLPPAANDDDEAPALARNLVKPKRPGRARKSVRRDREDAIRRGAYRASSNGTSGTSNAGPSVGPLPLSPLPLPTPANTNTITNDNAPITKTKAKRKRAPASWRNAGDLTRAVYINDALSEFGTPFAFTVNLGPDVIKAANENRRGFVDLIRRRVERHLEKELGPSCAWWFRIETTKDGRPHMHGAVAANGNELPAVRRALSKTGGTWCGAGKCYQTDVRVQDRPEGWARYTVKAAGQTRRHLREAAGLPATHNVPLSASSSNLKPVAKRLHEEERRAIVAAEKVAQEARHRPVAPAESETPPAPAEPTSESSAAPERHPLRSTTRPAPRRRFVAGDRAATIPHPVRIVPAAPYQARAGPG
ncbi:hypothetical protein [Methylobacterium oryzisoli]|uniref:hypothetical protein n=1 Tax=Methylobacterium oryzisoli TaxID=3385502 RepID=UPI00397A8CEF